MEDGAVSDIRQPRKGLKREWVNGSDFVMVSIPLTKELGGDLQAALVAGRIKFLSNRVEPDENGTQWVDTPAAEIAEDIGLSVKQVRRALTSLEERGFIVRENRTKTAWDRTLSVALVFE